MSISSEIFLSILSPRTAIEHGPTPTMYSCQVKLICVSFNLVVLSRVAIRSRLVLVATC